MARKIKIISVGKLKKDFWKDAFKFYIKRLKPYYSIEDLIVNPSNLENLEERKREEGKRILKRINKEKETLISLDVKGKELTTEEFSHYLKKWIESSSQYPCFIIGGAYGLWEEIKKESSFVISLSKLTFSHELTKIILLEQLYRATSIIFGHPYHH